MTRPPYKTTLHTWGHWATYILLAVLGFCAGRCSHLIADSMSVMFPHFPGPSAPETVGLLTPQLYGMVLLLILLVLLRRLFPKAAPFIAFFTLGFILNALLEGSVLAYVHLYERSFFGPPN